VSAAASVSTGLWQSVAAVWALFDRRGQYRLVALAFANLVGALLETLGAALVVPFVAMVGNPAYVQSQPALQQAYRWSGASTPEQFLVLVAIGLLIFFVLKNGYLAATLRWQFSFIYREMERLSTHLFVAYLHRPYLFHVGTNSAELVRNVSHEVLMFFTNVLVPAFTLLTEVAVVAAMTALLLWLAPLPALGAISVLALLAFGFHRFVRDRVSTYGLRQQALLAQRIKRINEGLGGIKEVKVLGREAHFAEAFAQDEHGFASVSRYAMVLNQMPRLFMETVAFGALFAGVGGLLLAGGDSARLLPMLALFAVASVRLMPSANRILVSINRIGYYRPSMEVVLRDARALHPPAASAAAEPPMPALPFEREIRLQGVEVRYPGSKTPALSEVDLVIRKGDTVALVGGSGAGKTTLADVVLGLLSPTRGRLLVDGTDVALHLRAWQRRLGYIPQTLYLCDDSIRRNVAFGLRDNEIDDGRVWNALALAQLKAHVQSLPAGLDTIVGERGVALSGGQRQRIAIARALYHDPDVLILDEATSALDEATEREVAEAIDSLAGRKTLLIIAHREATIRQCRVRVHLAGGRIQERPSA